MSLEENIKKWVVLDKKIKEITNNLKDLRTEKTKYNDSILTYVSNNNLENATVKITDGKLRFINTNYSQPLTYKYIFNCLNKYYKNDDEALDIINFIKSQREIKTLREIKRYTTSD